MDLQQKAEDIISDNPGISRRELADALKTTEWQARNLKSKIIGRPLGPSVAYFDVETSDLKPEMGRTLIACILSYPSMEYHTFRIDEMCRGGDVTEDIDLVVAARDVLMQHSVVCGWYSKGFDVPWLNTRLVINGERKLPTHLHLDLYYLHKGWHSIKPTRGSLKAAAEFWGLEEAKYEVSKLDWTKAAAGNKKSLDILVERCESDVRLTAQVAEKCFEHGLVKNIQRYA